MSEGRFQGLRISQADLLAKLESGELVVVSRKAMEKIDGDQIKVVGPITVVGPATEWLDLHNREKVTFQSPVAPDPPPLRINLGSGQRPFGPGWVNVDIRSKWNPDIIADGSNLRAYFGDNTADMIVLHHVLEHFGCGEADAMLRECYRVLKPGGSLIVTVPDMAILADAYIRGNRMDTQLFMTNVYGAYMGDEADRHRWGYDFASLQKSLYAAASFITAEAFDFRPIPGADIAKDWWILGMEATK